MEYVFWGCIVGFMVLEFIIRTTLRTLNRKSIRRDLPKEVEGIYDAEQYRKQQDYFVANYKMATVRSVVVSGLSIGIVALGVLGWVDNQAWALTENQYGALAVFFVVVNLADTVIDIPFDYYDTFVTEERFGFNKTTKKTFWLDLLKSTALSLGLSLALLLAVMWLYNLWPKYFVLTAWAVAASFSLFMLLFYSNLIVPLFNKQTPLEEGELRDAIKAFADRVGFKLNDIYVMDGSKRSTHGNAYFTGLGRKKRIVLYDTLIADLTTDEIVAVLAHEIGHYKKRHIVSSMVMSMVMMAVQFGILQIFLGNEDLAHALGGDKATFELSLVGFFMLFAPIELILGFGEKAISRKHEYEADAFAATNGMGEGLISGLKKMSVKSLSNLLPHKWYVRAYYSHPTLLQRIGAIKQEMEK